MILDFYNKLVLDVLYSFNSFLLIVSYKLHLRSGPLL